MELWDAYDININKIEGCTLVRGAPIPEGLFHMVCDIIVRHTDGTYLLMQRDEHKHYGGLWEASAGGSALMGETPMQCAQRELREETGISRGELCEVGRLVHKEHRAIYFEYLCITDVAKDSITLQEGETQNYMWVSREELVKMYGNRLVTERMQLFINELKR